MSFEIEVYTYEDDQAPLCESWVNVPNDVNAIYEQMLNAYTNSSDYGSMTAEISVKLSNGFLVSNYIGWYDEDLDIEEIRVPHKELVKYVKIGEHLIANGIRFSFGSGVFSVFTNNSWVNIVADRGDDSVVMLIGAPGTREQRLVEIDQISDTIRSIA